MSILTINSGSSSIKFALYKKGDRFERLLYGKVDRVGLSGTSLDFNNLIKNKKGNIRIEDSDHKSVANFLIDWLEKQIVFSLISGVGHRVVFGMKHTDPEFVTHKLLNELHRSIPYDSDHLPAEIELWCHPSFAYSKTESLKTQRSGLLIVNWKWSD